MTPAERLRAAADRIERLAKLSRGEVIDGLLNDQISLHEAALAGLGPDLAGPLVELLIAVSDDIVRYGYDETVSYQVEALELADAILAN